MAIFPLLPMAAMNFSINWIKVGLGILLVLVLIYVVAVFIPWLQDFRHEMKYLNVEIQRTEGREQQHWIKKKRRLWLSLLPFVRYH